LGGKCDVKSIATGGKKKIKTSRAIPKSKRPKRRLQKRKKADEDRHLFLPY